VRELGDVDADHDHVARYLVSWHEGNEQLYTPANQHLGQAAHATREPSAATARTRVIFQSGQRMPVHGPSVRPWLTERRPSYP
jgi:hypothetical protein